MTELETSQPVSWQRSLRGAKSSPAWFVADAWKNPDYLIFSLKISLCATLCYILYSALHWPGISTSVLTVLIVGLTTTGAISQKLIFRIAGSLLGGVVLGIGSMVFLFPQMDTISSFVLLVSGVAFLAAWMARSPHFSYIGLQMAFSYFLIAFEDYSAPTSMLPARDRILGIALALFVMWVVFLEIAPRKTVTEMRLALAHVLAEQAELLRLNASGPKQDMRQGSKLRELIVHQLVSLRGMSEMVPYEITTRRQFEQQQSDRILEASLAAGNLFLTAETRVDDLQEARKDFSQQNLAIAKELEVWASHLRDERLHPHKASSILPPAENKLQNSYLRLEKALLAIGNPRVQSANFEVEATRDLT